MTAEYVLEVKDIYKNFGPIRALCGVSLGAEKGKITAVIGDNGSGKSTLIKIISGNLRADSGIIKIDGIGYDSLGIRQALDLGIRTVYQDLALDELKSSAENIFLGDELMRGPFIDRKAMRREAARLLKELDVGITDIDAPVRTLSGGQRQGLAIARALRRPGRVLLLDEPTAAMGIQESRRTLDLLNSLRERGHTMLMVSHNIHQVSEIADHVYVMRGGLSIADTEAAASSAEELRDFLLKSSEEAD